MGGPYNIPRNYKGENKILFVFSTKAFMYTGGGVLIGVVLYYILSLLALKTLGIVFIVLFGFIGFALGTFKVPEINTSKFSAKTGGEPLDEVIIRWIKFKRKNKRIYVYKPEEEKKDV